MATVKLGIHKDYVPTWGIWEGIRDLVQNALDEDDKGNTLSVKHRSGKLYLTNEGSTLPDAALLIGYSTKADDDTQRGQYGEGLKLALLALLRKGLLATIYSGGKSYRPQITHDAKLGADTLSIKVGKSSRVGSTQVVIDGVTKETWESIRTRFTRWAGWTQTVKTIYGTLILDPEAAGKIYVKGIYVCDMKGLENGFDLSTCSLDRDRAIPSQWDLEFYTGKVVADALAKEEVDPHVLIEAFENDSPVVRQYGQYNQPGADKVAEAIKSAHPDAEAFAFTQDEVDNAGTQVKVVKLPKRMRDYLGTRVTGVCEAVAAKRNKPSRVYATDELPSDEQSMLLTLQGFLDHPMQIVDCATSFQWTKDNKWLIDRAALTQAAGGDPAFMLDGALRAHRERNGESNLTRKAFEAMWAIMRYLEEEARSKVEFHARASDMLDMLLED